MLMHSTGFASFGTRLVKGRRSFRSSHLGGLQLVPTSLVPTLRTLFQTQGIDPSAVDNNGNVDPQALLALAFDQVEIKTNATPTMTMNLKGPSDPATQQLLNQLQPTLIFSGPAGRAVIAPQGAAGAAGGDWFSTLTSKAGIGIAAGVVGTALLLIAIGRR